MTRIRDRCGEIGSKQFAADLFDSADHDRAKPRHHDPSLGTHEVQLRCGLMTEIIHVSSLRPGRDAMLYAFRLLNHLSEAHETHLLRCEDDAHAIACGRELLHRGYPIEITHEARCICILNPVVVILDDFVRHLLGCAQGRHQCGLEAGPVDPLIKQVIVTDEHQRRPLSRAQSPQ